MPETAPGLRVTLVNAFAVPFDNAIATARTCYSSRIITPAEVSRDERAQALRDSIAQSTYQAGHHTTLQHATFQFALSGVSRQCLWSFLHAHPHYNSEQVSQRYVAVRPERAYVPPDLSASGRERYMQALRRQMQAYQDLVAALTPAAETAYFAVFPARRKKADAHAGAIKKRAQEVARYVLPIATHAHLYHTVSGLTLHRYHRLMGSWDVPTETQAVIGAMVDAVRAHDPLFFRDIEDPLPLEATPEHQALQHLGGAGINPDAARVVAEMDRHLAGAPSRLIASTPEADAVLALSVRLVLGTTSEAMPNEAALSWVLDPKNNALLGNALNLTAHSKLGRALSSVHYTFLKRLSHAADSQDQRHRSTPGARPLLHRHLVPGSPDVVVPGLIGHSAQAEDIWKQAMAQSWADVEALVHDGASVQDAMYLLPNAVAVRFVSSGDLAGWRHKWVSRLCYNAQEEIWLAALSEVRQVSQVHPGIGAHMMPPCGVRHAAGMRPVCPEGARFCGVPVWKLARGEYRRVL